MGATKKARVLVTMDCGRSCTYCCNTYRSIMSQMKTVKLDGLAEFDEILITGGEPLLYPTRIISILKELRRKCRLTTAIYLYTADIGHVGLRSLLEIIHLTDGIQYSIHEGADYKDIEDFELFQHLIAFGGFDKSFRLYVDPMVDYKINIIPSVWKRVEIKPWIKEEDCKLPEGETLFYLEE